MPYPLVFFDISIAGKPTGRITMELFTDTAPRTAENFRALCTGEMGVGQIGKLLYYKNTTFHRIISGCMCQGGDIIAGDGSGSESICGLTFNDEDLRVRRHIRGSLSMANWGENTNGSQFFICLKEMGWLDGKNCVFGQVIDGMNVVEAMSEVGSVSGKPSETVVITDCGQFKIR